MGGPFADVSFLYDPHTQALVQYVTLPTGHKFCFYEGQTPPRRTQGAEDRSINEIKIGTKHVVVLLAFLLRKRLFRWGKKLLKLAGDKEAQTNLKQQINEKGEEVAQHVDRLFKNPPAAIGSFVVTAFSLPFRMITLLANGVFHTVVPEGEPDSPAGIPPKQTRRDLQLPAQEQLMETFGGMGGSAAGAAGAAGLPKGAASLEEFARKMQEGMKNAGWFQPAGAKAPTAGQGSGSTAKDGGAGERQAGPKPGPSVGSAEGLQEYLAHLMRQGMFGDPVMLPDPDLDMEPDPDFGEGPMMDDPDPDFDLDEDEDEYEEAF